MIPKSKTELPESLVSQLSQTLSKEESSVVQESPKRDRQAQINFSIPEDIKVNWKILCDKNHVNLKQGITFAMEHLIHEIDNGEAILTIGGVISKKS